MRRRRRNPHHVNEFSEPLLDHNQRMERIIQRKLAIVADSEYAGLLTVKVLNPIMEDLEDRGEEIKEIGIGQRASDEFVLIQAVYETLSLLRNRINDMRPVVRLGPDEDIPF